jgi:zinc protease
MKRFPVLFLLVFLMMIARAPAEDSRLDESTLPESRAQVFSFENGLTLIVEEDRSAPVASVQAWCATGSVNEGKWMGAGLSHILEHMLFKGTASRKAGEIARQIQDRGGYINAYTSFDRTVYWIDVPTDGVAEALSILWDAMMNSTLPEDEYTKEQEVIRREFAMGFDDPGRQSSQLMLRTVFSESPFQHPIIGYLDVYNKLKRDDVMAYYKLRYVPNNLTFVVTGDVDAQKVRSQLEEALKDYPRQPVEPVYIATEPEQIGRREAHEEFPTELTRLSLAWRIPGLTHPDAPPLELLGSVLGTGRSSILNQELREKQRLVHSVDAGMFSLQTDGVFVIQAICDPVNRSAAEKEALSAVERIKENGGSPAELDKARRLILANQLSGLATMRGKASDLGSSWLLTRNPNFSKDYLDAIARVTTEDLQRVAQAYLRSDKLNVTSLNPPGSLSADKRAGAQDVRSEVKKFVLPNGLRLLVCEDPRLPLISLHATFRGGLLAEVSENNGITKLLSRALLKGTKERTSSQLAEEIESVGGRFGADSGNNSFSVNVEVMKPNLALGLNVLADILQNPIFPEEEVALEKATQIAAIKAEDEQITTVARNIMREKLFGKHPYALRNSGRADSVEKITPADLMAFQKDYVVANNGVLAVFGDVKAEEVLKLVEKDFGTMPAGELALSQPPKPLVPNMPIDAVEERKKQQAVVMIGYPGTDVLSPDRTALDLLNEASNDLGSRFFNRIREQLGLAYFVGAGNFLGLAPGSFVFYLGTDPKKVAAVSAEFEDEISALSKDGLTEDELVRAKKKLIGSEAIRNQSNSAFATSVAIDELVGLGFDNYKRRKEQIEAVTLDEIRRVATKYFATPSRVEVIVRPPEKTAANSILSPQS